MNRIDSVSKHSGGELWAGGSSGRGEGTKNVWGRCSWGVTFAVSLTGELPPPPLLPDVRMYRVGAVRMEIN